MCLDNVSHAFPDLNGDDIKSAKNGTDTGMLFRPMFNTCDSSGTITRSSGSKPAHQTTKEDPLKPADRRGYEHGFAAGRLKACEMVQNELSLIIEDLQSSLKQYDQCRQMLADIYSVNSLKMALAIVEKISGKASNLKIEDLTEVRTIIHEAMQESFGLDFRFSPQDYKYIETLPACENTLDWKKYMQIAISKDDTINAGAVACSPNQQEWVAIHKQVTLALNKVMVVNDNLPV